MTFEPEIGQAAFSNSPWGEVDSPGYVTAGIDALAGLVSKGQYVNDHTNNVGAEPFDNETFQLRAYCRCDGEAEGHEDGCPPNFKCGDFEARWYKHSHRGASQNQDVTDQQWWAIMKICVRSLVEDWDSV